MQIFTLLFITLTLTIPSTASAAIKWTILEKNDPIEVIAPAHATSKQLLQDVEMRMRNVGYCLSFFPDLLGRISSSPYSNTKEYRQKHLRDVLENEEIKAIWALNGGDGTLDVLETFDINQKLSPKLIIGCGDITGLHLLADQWKWPCLHGPVLLNSGVNSYNVMDILLGKTKEVQYMLIPLNRTACSGDINIETTVIGGNLSVIQKCIGTKIALNADGRILFLEVKVPSVKAYKAFKQLLRCGTLGEISALVLGHFYNDYESEYDLFNVIIGEKMDKRGIPLFFSERLGQREMHRPLPFNTPAAIRLDHNKNVEFTVQTNN